MLDQTSGNLIYRQLQNTMQTGRPGMPTEQMQHLQQLSRLHSDTAGPGPNQAPFQPPPPSQFRAQNQQQQQGMLQQQQQQQHPNQQQRVAPGLVGPGGAGNPFMQQNRLQQTAISQQHQFSTLGMGGGIAGFGPQPGGPAGMVTGRPGADPRSTGPNMGAGGMAMGLGPNGANPMMGNMGLGGQRPPIGVPGGMGGGMGGLAGASLPGGGMALSGQQQQHPRNVSNPGVFIGGDSGIGDPSSNAGMQVPMSNGIPTSVNAGPSSGLMAMTPGQLQQQDSMHNMQQIPTSGNQQQQQAQQLGGPSQTNAMGRPPSATFQQHQRQATTNNLSPGRPGSTVTTAQQTAQLLQRPSGMAGPPGGLGRLPPQLSGSQATPQSAMQNSGATSAIGPSGVSQPHPSHLGIGHPTSQPQLSIHSQQQLQQQQHQQQQHQQQQHQQQQHQQQLRQQQQLGIQGQQQPTQQQQSQQQQHAQQQQQANPSASGQQRPPSRPQQQMQNAQGHFFPSGQQHQRAPTPQQPMNPSPLNPNAPQRSGTLPSNGMGPPPGGIATGMPPLGVGAGGPGQMSGAGVAPGNIIATPSQQAQRVASYTDPISGMPNGLGGSQGDFQLHDRPQHSGIGGMMGSQLPQPSGPFGGPPGVGLGISSLPPNTPSSQQRPMSGGPQFNQHGQIVAGNPSLVSLGDPMPDHLAVAMRAAQEMAHQANSPSYVPGGAPSQQPQPQAHHTGGPIGHPGGPHPPQHQGSMPPPSHQGPPMQQQQPLQQQHGGPPGSAMSARQQSVPAPQTPHSQQGGSVPPPTVRMPVHGLPQMSGPVGFPGPPTMVKAESLPPPGFGAGGNQDGSSGSLSGAPLSAGPSGIRAGPGQFNPGPPTHIGSGQGVLRLLEFSNAMASGKQDLEYWDNVASDFFVPNRGLLRMTLRKQDSEAKMFEVFSPTLPRFFLSSWCSGVQSISLGLNGVHESCPAPGEGLVECQSASFTYTFDTGYIVTLIGLLRVHILLVPNDNSAQANNVNGSDGAPHKLKFSYFEFTSKKVNKSLSVGAIKGTRTLYTSPSATDGSSPTATVQGHVSPSTAAMMGQQPIGLDGLVAGGASDSSGVSTSPTLVNGIPEPVLLVERAFMPPDPVNEFGITQCTMRVLELAESMDYLSDLINLSWDRNVGPIQALQEFGERIRTNNPSDPALDSVVQGQLQGVNGQLEIPGGQGDMKSVISTAMTQSPSLLHNGVASAQQQLAAQQIAASQQTLMGSSHQSMLNGPNNPYHARQPPNGPQNPMNNFMQQNGTPTMTNAGLQNQNGQQINSNSPHGRPPSSQGGHATGGNSGLQQRPPSVAGSSFGMPPPSQPIGPSSGKRKATMDASAPETAPESQAPPARRQRTGASGSLSSGGGATFTVDGNTDPKEATAVTTRARGRKSPVAVKAPLPPRGVKGRRGTNT
ncbi:hypothetical protein FRB93_012293 [Tulasnella sp. JGI-2019a]|nr:hypothetical protein FRB93_012293 [Tulasnella sp. JGI-2019a]